MSGSDSAADKGVLRALSRDEAVLLARYCVARFILARARPFMLAKYVLLVMGVGRCSSSTTFGSGRSRSPSSYFSSWPLSANGCFASS